MPVKPQPPAMENDMKILLVSAALLSLGACMTTKTIEKPVPQYVTVEVYPDLPDIELPALKLENIEFDVHRQQIPMEHRLKKTPECVDVPPLKRDLNFWNNCLDKAPPAPSNLYIGVDRRNSNILMLNNAKIAEREDLLRKTLIEPENKRRRKWREYNKAIRERER
jgi:hypothetical protein